MIRGVVVEPVPFDIERDLVTPTMKKKRSQMLKYYQVYINSHKVNKQTLALVMIQSHFYLLFSICLFGL